jgi:hypothetical protein
MAVTAGQMTTEPASSAPPPGGMPEIAEAPRLAEGVELLGEYKDSGYSQPRRSSGGRTARSSRCPRCCTG